MMEGFKKIFLSLDKEKNKLFNDSKKSKDMSKWKSPEVNAMNVEQQKLLLKDKTKAFDYMLVKETEQLEE